MPGRDVFIVGCVRTPIGRGRKDGSLHDVHPVDLLAHTLNALVERSHVDKAAVEDVICGCVTPLKEQGANIGRIAVLKAGFPIEVPSVQLNRMCGSGQQAVHFASQAIGAGDMECVIACGVEMMGVVPMGSDSDLMSGKAAEFQKTFPYRLMHQGQSADLIAKKYGVTRAECDALAKESHRRASVAREAGLFDSQIAPVRLPNGETFAADEGVRYPVDDEKMAALRTIFSRDGVVTAANASQISDGAAAVMLCSGEFAAKHNLVKRARIVARVVVGSCPELMLTAPIPATQKVLARAGLTIDQIDVVEINEAFASVVLSWAKEIKPKSMDNVNPNGGAIAHGHPLGATGCILMTKLVHELERSNKRFGLQTMCIGHGQGTATIIENLQCTRARL